MTPRNYATLDPAKLPPDTTLERSSTTAYTAAASTPQTVRSTQPKSAGVWYVQWIPYGTLGTGADIRVGLCLAAQSETAKLGEDGNGVAYCADGTIRSNGTTVATIDPYTVDDVIGMTVDGAQRTVQWTKNGNYQAASDAEWPGSAAVTPAATLLAGSGDSSTTPELRLLFSAGQQTMVNVQGAGGIVTGNVGWFEPLPGIGLLRVADRAYRDPSSPHDAWQAGVSKSALSVTRSVSFWPWGKSSARASATLRLVNNDGRFDNLLVSDARDAAVTIRTLAGDTLGDAVTHASLIVDSVQAHGDGAISLTLRDTTAALETPMQRRVFLPTADESVAAKPWPLLLGAVRSLPLTCMDAEEQIYAINDGPIAGVGSIRDRGAPFAPSLGDYVLQQDGAGTVTLASVAQGKVTADISTIGGDTPSAPMDLLDGKGDFSNAADWTLPSNWSISPAGRLNVTADGSSMQLCTGVALPFTMTAGETYMVRVTLRHLTDGPYTNTSNAAPSVFLGLSYGSTGPSPFVSDLCSPVRAYTPRVRGASSGSPAHDDFFDADTQPLVIIFTAQRGGSPWLTFFSAASYASSASLTSVVVWKLLDTELDDESLIPIPFTAAMTAILRDRLGWQDNQWSIADCTAIDAATGYAGIGLASTTETPLTVAQAVQMVCDAYSVDTWQDETGMLRFARLIDPAGETPELTITEQDIVGDIALSIDLAPGLTTQLGARKNWMPLATSEMVSDDVGLPYTTDGGAAA